MLSIEQDESVFAAALRVAEQHACNGNDTAEIVRCAKAVVTAAKEVQEMLDAEDE